MMTNPILQGWLEKYKRSSSILGTNLKTKRWFTIESHHPSIGAGQEQQQDQDLQKEKIVAAAIASTPASNQITILSYYKSPRASTSDRSGWIFLNDVKYLEEYKEGDNSDNSAASSTSTSTAVDGENKFLKAHENQGKKSRNRMASSISIGGKLKKKSKECWVICIKHPSRVFRLVAVDHFQHQLWFDTLKRYCTKAEFRTDRMDDNVPDSANFTVSDDKIDLFHGFVEQEVRIISSYQTGTVSDCFPCAFHRMKFCVRLTHVIININCDHQNITPIKKLEPAEAIHKDVSERKRRESLIESDCSSKQEKLKAELAFMRGLNNNDHVSHLGIHEEVIADTMPKSEIYTRLKDYEDIPSETARFDKSDILASYSEEEENKTEICAISTAANLVDDDAKMFRVQNGVRRNGDAVTVNKCSRRGDALLSSKQITIPHDMYKSTIGTKYGDVDGFSIDRPVIEEGLITSKQNETLELLAFQNHSGDETLQKRFERAMSHTEENLQATRRADRYYDNAASYGKSDDFVGDEADIIAVDTSNNGGKELESACETKNQVDSIHTMVQEFSFDHSQDETSSSSIETFSDRINCEDDYKASSINRQLKMEQHSSQISRRERTQQEKTSISFDTDCSFLPDEDFLTANWDSD
jgi:hypothetical protein